MYEMFAANIEDKCLRLSEVTLRTVFGRGYNSAPHGRAFGAELANRPLRQIQAGTREALCGCDKGKLQCVPNKSQGDK
ncbi:predicted protein [Sclerotinia sclerotiorum 1980 UF-70]|uniref:Uncharacterized protein n=1 Tax=Sclerotinia sclerotiorum (strain ATCC 18683 / 1980 / Ss-1) TaxID=665079 RepID=A7EMN3_SCLS1|nr:predicted protein [Sclerotinia sclerotiorum 1980 UF-70]EDO04099.1 predicted protein [Sclerotinia sclerotiorum 1980 UF-70]